MAGNRRGRVKVRNTATGTEMPARDFVYQYGTTEVHENNLVQYDASTGTGAGKWPTRQDFVEKSIENARLSHGESWEIVPAEGA